MPAAGDVLDVDGRRAFFNAGPSFIRRRRERAPNDPLLGSLAGRPTRGRVSRRIGWGVPDPFSSRSASRSIIAAIARRLPMTSRSR